MATRKERQPEEIRELVLELRRLANRAGISESKLASSPRLLKLAARTRPKASEAELIVEARSLLERAVEATVNRRDRDLLYEGLNLGGSSIASVEGRINDVWAGMDTSVSGDLQAESASGKFRRDLLVELAWRVSGLIQPRPPESRVELAQRLQNQGRWRQSDDALLRVVYGAQESVDQKQEAWRLLALSAWEDRRFEDVLSDIANAVALSEQTKEATELVRTIDRMAVRFTDVEEYELASRMVTDALRQLPHDGTLWQRLGCIWWYSGDLILSVSALSTALSEGKAQLASFTLGVRCWQKWETSKMPSANLTRPCRRHAQPIRKRTHAVRAPTPSAC